MNYERSRVILSKIQWIQRERRNGDESFPLSSPHFEPTVLVDERGKTSKEASSYELDSQWKEDRKVKDVDNLLMPPFSFYRFSWNIFCFYWMFSRLHRRRIDNGGISKNSTKQRILKQLASEIFSSSLSSEKKPSEPTKNISFSIWVTDSIDNLLDWHFVFTNCDSPQWSFCYSRGSPPSLSLCFSLFLCRSRSTLPPRDLRTTKSAVDECLAALGREQGGRREAWGKMEDEEEKEDVCPSERPALAVFLLFSVYSLPVT